MDFGIQLINKFNKQKYIHRIHFGSPEHAVVQMELDQLLTWAAGSGVLVQVSIKAARIDTMCVELNIEVR